MMFDVGCLFCKEELEVTPIVGPCGVFLTGITWQVEKFSVFYGKVCRAKDFFFSEWIFSRFGNGIQSSMRANSTVMGVVGFQCASNAISFCCSCFGRTVQ